LQAHHCQWATLYMIGQHSECCRHTQAGLSLYERTRDSVHSGLYGGHDAKVCALGESALSQWMLGDYAKALACADAALRWSVELAHVGSQVHAMDYSLVLQKFRRNHAAVRSQAETLAVFAGEQRLRVFRAKGQFFRGWARAIQGEVRGGLEEMLDAIASERAADTPHDFTLYYEMLAEVYCLAGYQQEGLQAIREAFAIAERNGIVYWNAELHRRRGELLLLGDDREAAEAAFEEALSWARSQGARSLELRAAVALGRLSAPDGSRAVRTAVQPLYEALQGEADTLDLSEARSLLEALG